MNMESKASATPAWFDKALATAVESRFVEVAGCPIHYLRWGDSSRPGLLFVPGTGGHAHWFSHVAPLFADQFNVVAIDIGGCGDSGRREAYSLDLVIAEIMAVCADAGMMDAAVPPIIAGHSVGGQFTVRTALAHGDALLGVIAIDALRYAQLAKDPAIKAFSGPRPAPAPARLHPDRATAVARFRLQPEPLVAIETPYVMDHIAEHSVQEVEGGWTWKFDRTMMSIVSAGLDLKDRLADITCRSAAIYGEITHVADDDVIEKMSDLAHGRMPVFVIPGSGHYPMIDNPIAFVAAVKGVALAWVAEAGAAGSRP